MLNIVAARNTHPMYTLRIVHLGTLEAVFEASGSIPRLLELAAAKRHFSPAYSTVANAANAKGYYVADFLSKNEEDGNVPFLFLLTPLLK
ncbi:MAG: hypothetical protein ACRYFX_12725 [Janthinobacterium lividum]